MTQPAGDHSECDAQQDLVDLVWLASPGQGVELQQHELSPPLPNRPPVKGLLCILQAGSCERALLCHQPQQLPPPAFADERQLTPLQEPLHSAREVLLLWMEVEHWQVGCHDFTQLLHLCQPRRRRRGRCGWLAGGGAGWGKLGGVGNRGAGGRGSLRRAGAAFSGVLSQGV